MFEKEQQWTYPMPPAESGAEAAHDAEEKRNKKRNKRIKYILLFVVFQTAVILVFSLTVMKVRAPKFRLSAAVVTGISAGAPANTSFSATVNAELAVKNPNFGPYRFEVATVEFMHGGASAGTATVSSSRVNMKSTKRVQVAAVDLNLAGRDLSGGVLKVRSRSKMVGKVELMFGFIKKESSATMDCSMELVIATQQITNIACN